MRNDLPQAYLDHAKLIHTHALDLKRDVLTYPATTLYIPVQGNVYQYQVSGQVQSYLDLSTIPDCLLGRKGRSAILPDLVHGRPLVAVTVEKAPNGSLFLNIEDGCFASDKELNADYQIIAKVRVGPVEYALGEMEGKIPFFVTWECAPVNDRSGPPNYYWGHYFGNRDEAIEDFCDRASEKYKMLSESRKPSIKAQLAAKPVPGDQPTQKAKDLEAR